MATDLQILLPVVPYLTQPMHHLGQQTTKLLLQQFLQYFILF